MVSMDCPFWRVSARNVPLGPNARVCSTRDFELERIGRASMMWKCRTGRRRRKRSGVLTFEWILLISLLVIGVIGGLSAVRNALLCELGDLAECIESINTCGCGDGCGSPDDCSEGVNGCDDSWWCGDGSCN